MQWLVRQRRSSCLRETKSLIAAGLGSSQNPRAVAFWKPSLADVENCVWLLLVCDICREMAFRFAIWKFTVELSDNRFLAFDWSIWRFIDVICDLLLGCSRLLRMTHSVYCSFWPGSTECIFRRACRLIVAVCWLKQPIFYSGAECKSGGIRQLTSVPFCLCAMKNKQVNK